MEHYPTTKRNEVQIHAIMWTDVDNIMLSGKRQTQKATCCNLIYTKNPELVNPETEYRLVLATGWEERGRGEAAFV